MKFCMFCGEEIPDKAVFCPSCGAKQPIVEEQTEPEIEEQDTDEDSVALNLLNKANFSSVSSRKESIIPMGPAKKHEKKISRIEPKKQEITSDSDDIHIQTYIRKSESTGEITKEDISENNANPSQTENTDELNSVISDSNDDFMDAEAERILMSMQEFSESTPNEYQATILEDLKVENTNEKPIEQTKIVVENKSKNEGELKSFDEMSKKPAKHVAREKVHYQKRNLSEEDESDNDVVANAEMKRNSSLGFSNMNDDLTADERADIEKHNQYENSEESKKEDDEELETERVKGEGRKSNGRKKEARKNVDKAIAQRRLNKIEHEEVDKKDDIDPDYDGYYENVRPIDFDKLKDNSSLIKTIVAAASSFGLISLIFYLIITFFLQ